MKAHTLWKKPASGAHYSSFKHQAKRRRTDPTTHKDVKKTQFAHHHISKQVNNHGEDEGRLLLQDARWAWNRRQRSQLRRGESSDTSRASANDTEFVRRKSTSRNWLGVRFFRACINSFLSVPLPGNPTVSLARAALHSTRAYVFRAKVPQRAALRLLPSDLLQVARLITSFPPSTVLSPTYPT